MNAFRYCRDSLFLVACAVYITNRWIIVPQLHRGFMRGHLNDFFLIPCALPIVLWFERSLRLRRHDGHPTLKEGAFYLVVWSVLFELLGPHLLSRATGDAWDVFAYFAGGVAAYLWWHRDRLPRLELAR